MQDFGRAGSFMQVIDILRNDRYIKIFLQLSESDMSRIRLSRGYIPAPHIIKIKDQLRIFAPCPGCGHFCYIISFPKAITVTKRS